MISLFNFLGNTGANYARNRHNVAWQFCDSLDALAALSWQKKFHGIYAVTETLSSPETGKKWFLKPETFMNNSGQSAGELAHFFKIEPKNILVIHDELELPLGTVSLKWAGGLGGHNGLRSMEAVLGTRDFWRLRFGIGRPTHDDVAGYVLSDFLPTERDTIANTFLLAAPLFASLLHNKPDALLKEWAKKKITPPEKIPTREEISSAETE
jgi:PTH1 family peptidyl-tRNA hydrolase